MNISIRGLSKSFGSHKALSEVALEVHDARVLALIGPSGGGKSTLLRVLAGLEIPDAGTVSLDGETLGAQESALRTYRLRIGVVFQAFNLFPHLSAFENVVLPLVHVHGSTRAAAEKVARETLDRFRVLDHAGRRPGALSGGQRQRVAIARAIATKPKLLFFDEPTSALDPEMSAEVLSVIEELKNEGRKFVIVTHQLGFARRVADHVAFLARGAVVESGSSESWFTSPGSQEARRFVETVAKY